MKEGWVIRKLGEVCTSDLGKTLNHAKDTGELMPYLCSINVQWDRIDLSTVKQARFVRADCDRFSVRQGDLLVCEGGDIGRAAIWDSKTPMFYQNALHRVRFRDSILPRYCLRYLQHLKLIGALDQTYGKGVTIKHLVKSSLLSIPIPIPPIAEQEKIVAELDCLTGIIEKKKLQLDELDKLAQSIFYDMFGDIAHNSKLFPVEKICDLGELARGVSKHRPRNAPELLGGEMPLIQTGDVANADLLIREYRSTYSALGVSQSRVWEKGTICITIAANIGNCAILSFRACFPDSVVGFIPNDKLTLFYALFVFNNLQALLEEKARGLAQKNINLQILNELLIPVPSRDLQDLFAQKIRAIEKQKELVRRSIAENETLFNSRMDYWFN